MVLVSGLRLDLARRTVVLDCAVLVFTAATVEALDANGFQAWVSEPASGGVVLVEVDAEELRLWKEVLPAWVERCREWEHREGCEYHIGSGEWKAPVSTEIGGQVVCGCGMGVFPEDWKVDVPLWEKVKGLCVRAAISPLFPSALSEDVVPDLATLMEEMKKEQDMADGVNGCRNCGKEKSKEGGELKACSKCQNVKYCGRPCQRADWKRHKTECTGKK